MVSCHLMSSMLQIRLRVSNDYYCMTLSLDLMSLVEQKKASVKDTFAFTMMRVAHSVKRHELVSTAALAKHLVFVQWRNGSKKSKTSRVTDGCPRNFHLAPIHSPTKVSYSQTCYWHDAMNRVDCHQFCECVCHFLRRRMFVRMALV